MTIIQNITTGLSNTKSSSQAIERLNLMEARGGVSSHSTTPVDSLDIKHIALSDPSNHVHILEAGFGQKAILTFSEKTSEISALLVSKDGSSKAVSDENLPQDFKMIKSLDSFNGFLENAQARGTILSDGEAKLYVMQKGVGGMWKRNFNPVGPNGPMQPSASNPNGIMNWQQGLTAVERHQMANPVPNSGFGVGVHGSAHSVGGSTTVGTAGIHAGGFNPNGSATAGFTHYVANGHKSVTGVGFSSRINF